MRNIPPVVARHVCMCVELCGCRVAGFDGDHCEVNVDDCRNNRCANHATCVDAVHSYACRCPPQWQGALLLFSHEGVELIYRPTSHTVVAVVFVLPVVEKSE